MKRRIVSIITALALCLSLCPTWAFAAEGEPDTGLCPHHTEHTDCGYTAPTEGQPCGHKHTADCYTLGVLPDADGSEYYEIGPDTQNILDCQHSHDESCGYVQAAPGQPCGFVCPLCPIEDLIAALPDEVTADNAEDVRARLDGILALYSELDEAEQEQIDLSRCMELQEALDAANAPVPAEGEVNYREAEWKNSEVIYSDKTANCTPVESDTTEWTDGGWYVVNSTVTIDQPITVEGNVSLILADGCTLTADKGIVVTENNSLTIYAQSEGNGAGTLNATGVFDNNDNTASAGIGGSATDVNSGAVTIHGGRIHATGGGQANYCGAAGIGGGVPYTGAGGDSGAVTIYGGTVTADSGYGGNRGNTGAGIGGGAGKPGGKGGDGTNITIYDGTVTATSYRVANGIGGAGIGGGSGGDANGGAGSNIHICGGTVTATGGTRGAGIGGGGGSGDNNASGSGSNITISGGAVTAVGGDYAAGIGGGGGYSNRPGGAGTYIEITGGIVDAYSPDTDLYWTGCEGDPIGNGGNVNGDAADVDKADCIIFENGVGRVYGYVNLTETYDVPAGYSLTISSGAELVGNGKLTGGGEFWIEDITEDMISVPEGWHYTGDDMTAEIKAAVSLNGDVEICGKTFKADTTDWILGVMKMSGREYAVTYTRINGRTVVKTVTLEKAATTLSGVAAYKWDGTTPATAFGVGDAIVVKATPEIPPNAAVAAASFVPPVAKEMALFVGDTQVSFPKMPDQDGSYTMTASTYDVLAAAQAEPNGGAITLTAQFVGNTNMADAAGTVDVTITATVKVVKKDGTTAYYSSILDAWRSSTSTVTLLADANTTSLLTVRGGSDITLNDSPYTLSVDRIDIDGGKLTVNGSTISSSTGPTVRVSAGELLVQGGTIKNLDGYAIYVASRDGSVRFKGGTAVGEINNGFEDLSATLAHEGETRYAFYQDGQPVALQPGQRRLPFGTYTVAVCGHQGAEITPDENDPGKHNIVCPFCGQNGAEDCGFGDWTPVDETNHQRTCKLCGYVETEAHTLALSARSEGFTIIVTAKCSACGYAAEYSRETITNLGSLVYGQGVPGISLRNQSGESARYAIYRLDDDAKEMTSLPAELPAGDHILHAVLVFGEPNSYIETNSVDIPFTVKKKPLAVSGAAAAGRAYNGTNTVTITGVTLSGKVKDTDDVSVDTSSLTGTINGTDAGDYASVTLPAMTLTGVAAGNYTLTHPTGAVPTDVTISKANPLPPKTGDLAVANKQAHTYVFGLGTLRPDAPAGMSLGSTAVTYTLGSVNLGSYYTGGAKIEGQTLTVPVEKVESGSETGIGTITVIIHTGNFADMTATINVRSVNKIIPTGAPTLSTAQITYGQTVGSIVLSGSMTAPDGKEVEGKFTWASPENKPAAQEKYEAAWTFTPEDNREYAIVTGISVIKVVPAPITGAVIELDPTTFRYDGLAHTPDITDVKLGNTVLRLDVDYTAEVPTETEAGTYTVTVTGKGNYTGTAVITFTINPVEQQPIGEDMRLEVETGLSTVPEALQGNEKYNTTAKIETALRVAVEQAMTNAGDNIAVFDVTLQYKDETGQWRNVDPNDFPADGVTAILPYPAGTGQTGYTFTVQHLISSGDKVGTMETLPYELTANGLKCRFMSLSPVAIGYQAETKPNPTPNPGGNSGGGSSVSTYAVTIEKSAHGKVTSNRTNASSGSTVTLTVIPDSGYVLDTLTVIDSRGNEIKLTAQSGGKYTFTMPSRAVTVKATFAPLPDDAERPCDGGTDCPSYGFTDLGTVGTWYHEAVDYVLRNGLMGGYSSTMFGPNDNLTRAQFAQILFNKEGRPGVNYLLQYSDVADSTWYTEAVRWATSQGIVGGYGDGRFGPNDNITREQLAVMLWRYAGSPAATDKELHFTDRDKASGYALEALRWAVENGIINGYGDGRLGPDGLATRAQVAQMLKNFLNNQ